MLYDVQKYMILEAKQYKCVICSLEITYLSCKDVMTHDLPNLTG